MRELGDNLTVWLLYHPPMKGARTGHAGLLVTKDVLNEQENLYRTAVYYFSMYHDWYPDNVRNLGGRLLTTSIPAFVVDDYQSDVMMRGQSWERIIDRKEKENEPVRDLVAGLPQDAETQERLFVRGAYQYAIRLDKLNPHAVMHELERIKSFANWAYMPQVTSKFCLDLSAYNCSSAIDDALYQGTLKPYQRGGLGEMLHVFSMTTRFFYFMVMLSSLLNGHIGSALEKGIFYAPAVLLLLNALKSAVDFIRLYDLNVTPLGQLRGTKLYALVTFLSAVNMLGLPFTNRGIDLLIDPTGLASKAQKVYGGKLFSSGFVDLPKFGGRDLSVEKNLDIRL